MLTRLAQGCSKSGSLSLKCKMIKLEIIIKLANADANTQG